MSFINWDLFILQLLLMWICSRVVNVSYINVSSHHGISKNRSCSRRCYLGMAPRAQLLKKSAWLLHLIGDKAPPVACDSSEVARTSNRRCCPHTGNGGHSWYLSSSLPLSVGFSIQDEAIDGDRSAQQAAHYHADVIYLLPWMRIKKGNTYAFYEAAAHVCMVILTPNLY